MSEILKKEVVNQVQGLVKIPWHEIKAVLSREALLSLGVDEKQGETTVKVVIHQDTQGSPSYSISSWYALVEVVQQREDQGEELDDSGIQVQDR